MAIVKRALQEHVDLDPVGTIKILCDQCVFVPDVLDEEERILRGRVRALVLNFFSEKYRVCIARVAEKYAAEEELLKGLKGVSLSLSCCCSFSFSL